MRKGKIVLLAISLIMCFSFINVYAKDNNDNSYTREYSTYKNAIERLMISVLNKNSLSSSDITLLKSLDKIENSKTDKLLLIDEEYKDINDNRLLQIKSDLSIEISTGYEHTYKNAIEKQISSMLNKDNLSSSDISFMQQLSKINAGNKSNSKKVDKLNELKKSGAGLNYKMVIDSLINSLKDEAPISPKASELKDKTLIIGEYIIYMPSLTTDNLMIAKNTLAENCSIYYKSEFLNGKWIAMDNVNEIYNLMINDSYKVVEDESILDKIEYMAYINENSELIEYRKFKDYIAALGEKTTDDSEESDGMADDINTQLVAAQAANLENSLSNVFAESRTLESKLDAIEELYETTQDNKLQQLISDLKAEIANSSTSSNTGYDNSIKKFIDNITDKDSTLVSELEKINGVPQSVKDERDLKEQLAIAEAKNNTLEANTIKLMLGMDVQDNSIDLKKIADEFRSQGLENLAAMVQGESFSSEEINSTKPFDEQFNNLIASAVLLSGSSTANLNNDIINSINANKDKNKDLLKNLMDASLNTIKTQCNTILSDREVLAKQLLAASNEKDALFSDLEAAINNNDKEKVKSLYNKIQEKNKQIADICNEMSSGKQTIQNLCNDMDSVYNSLKLPLLKSAKAEFDTIEENNSDYLIRIVDLMIKRYILIEEYKVEKNKGHTVSMSKLRDEISNLDYSINYILSLKILDKEQIDIEYNIRLAQLLNDNTRLKSYTAKKSAYNSKLSQKADAQNAIILKAEELLK